MSFTPTVGQVAVLDLTLGGGAAHWIGPGINWKLHLDPKVVDKSNFRDGRIKNATLPDGTLTLTIVYDQADSPFKTTGGNITMGATGTARCFVDATHYWTVPVIVGPLDLENSGMEDDLGLEIEFDLNGTAVPPVGV